MYPVLVAGGLSEPPGEGGGTKFLKNWLTIACSDISVRSYRALFLHKNLGPRPSSVDPTVTLNLLKISGEKLI
jgi:hypothetical protein